MYMYNGTWPQTCKIKTLQLLKILQFAKKFLPKLPAVQQLHNMSFLFAAVPSSNKRDVRSIEETLIDLKSKKKAKLEAIDDS